MSGGVGAGSVNAPRYPIGIKVRSLECLLSSSGLSAALISAVYSRGLELQFVPFFLLSQKCDGCHLRASASTVGSQAACKNPFPKSASHGDF